ncbi:hypothetical protein K458DRAFT_417212 [Lentithecium fluviatile CBS 122367]|uniref:Conserved oligomeric Golgi complex subunit 2 n=1 Tax=Lentithecium fluviatile CBS 122367 TaxID=1168545 RepID=A0A6G1J3N1_9PLEO|nr:hypothetical protein K458DRAFT_417212 [Lentithecium fluviatile CBS 122367]
MSRFYIEDDSRSHSSNSNESSDDELPYPAPLPRSAFLAPDFTPSSYLSTLHNRHQTLEDLRAELRARSQLLSRELLDLVNANYQDFLGLGRSLKGGDERVEEVRVGLLGFRKEVEGLRDLVAEREIEVQRLVGERRRIGSMVAVGRRLVEFEGRLKGLEEGLVIETTGKERVVNGDGEEEDVSDSEESDEEDEDEDEGALGVPIAKLRRNVLQYRVVQELEKGLGEHPFVAAQMPRMMKVRNTLLLDLSTALQQAKAAGSAGADRVMKVMKIYADMDESAEVVKVLKSLKT